MDDVVSKQAAISLPVMPKKYRKYQTYNLDDAYEQGWEDLQKCIERLPSAQTQRKKGKWIEHNPHKWGLGIIYECSECGYEMDCEEPNYCPHCGADMRGKSDE